MEEEEEELEKEGGLLMKYLLKIRMRLGKKRKTTEKGRLQL